MAQAVDTLPTTVSSRKTHTPSHSTLSIRYRLPFASHTPSKSFSVRVFVRDRPGAVAGEPAQERFWTLARVPGKAPSLAHSLSSSFDSRPPRTRTMAKRQHSLQTILIPSFLQSPVTSPTSSTRTSPQSRAVDSSVSDPNYFIPPVDPNPQSIPVTEPRPSRPPSFLLDDDPFANLTAAPSELPRVPTAQSSPSSKSVKPTQPRSPLMPASSPASVKGPPRAASKSVSGRMPVPAHQKPAFAPKPSLPSLDTLARMNIVLPKKARKGRVGAGLPFEPWDHPEVIASFPTPRSPRPSTSPASTPTGFVSSPLDGDEDISLPRAPPIPLDLEPSGADIDTVTNSVVTTAEHASQSAPRSHPNEIDHCTIPDDSARSFTIDQAGLLPAGDDLTPSTSLSLNHINQSLLPDFTLSLSHDDTFNEPELPYTTDTEPSLPALSPSGCSLTESLASSLSRSTSCSSGSSSDDYNFGVDAPTSRYGNEDHNDIDGLATPPRDLTSAVRENDLLNSSVLEDIDYFSFPTAYTSETVATISSWRHDTHTRTDEFDNNRSGGQQTDEAISTATLACVGEPDILMYPNRRQHPPGSTGFVRPRHVGGQSGGELVDGTDYDPYREASGSSSGTYSYAQPKSYGYGDSGIPGSRHSAASGGSGDGRGDDGDGRNSRRPSQRSMFSNTSSSSEVTSDEEDESADDNVPLAQSIPTALTAQKSIRKQVRDERDQRRKERAGQAGKTEARSRQTTLRPVGAGGPIIPQAMLSSSQEAALHARSSSGPAKSKTRQRTQTLSSLAAPRFSADDLTKKLQDIQVRHRRDPSGAAGSVDAFGGLMNPETFVATADNFASPQPSKMLRTARSLHRLQARPVVDDHRTVPLPQNVTQQLHRARSQGRLREDYQKPVFEDAQRVPVPRISDDQRRSAREPSVRSVSTRPSMEGDRERERERRPSRRPSTADREHRPPIPPLPTTMPELPKQVTQQRVFIGDMQRYNVVGIDDTTSAGEVVQMVESQGGLKGWIGSGEWMVWEISHDFGMERPIRHFERLSDVQASWNKDKLINTFVLRLTSLAPLLSRSTIPSSSPTHGGYVEWEVKRGKWSKRWLQLREHSLWISKRDNGKDQTLLCSLSNFDAYHFCRPYKSPKPFALAIKSTDKLSFFENASDYKHIISCSEKDGKIWMEKILLARSYVLHQERNILFNPKSYGGQPTVATGGPARVPTQRRPTQPLVSVVNNDLFEPGSLLHRKG